MDFIKIDNALELRDFLNGIADSELRDTNLENNATGSPIRGIKIRVNTLTDGSETTDYVFVSVAGG